MGDVNQPSKAACKPLLLASQTFMGRRDLPFHIIVDLISLLRGEL